MSVEQISAAETPQRNNSTTYAVTGGATAGVAGAGAGYFFGKAAPDLDKVFAMKPDTFEGKVKDLTGEEKTAADKIKAEIERIDGLKIDSEVEQRYKRALASVPETDVQTEADALKAKQTAYNESLLAKANEGKEEANKFKAVSDIDAEAKKTAEEAIKDSTAAKELETAKQNLETAKVTKLKGKEVENAERKAVEAFEQAKTDLASKKTGEISKSVAKDEFKTAYAKIKGALKEVSWKNVGIWGGIALAAGAIIGYLVGGNKNA